jgi:catechol 2,3-dioxygenase-like lactoylglutathione lyase family enzyme
VRLAFVYCPVNDVEAALRFYRDLLGFEVAWREGETTVGLRLPDTDVRLMLDHDDAEDNRAGPVFLVTSVDAFWREHRETVRFIRQPVDIPGGRWAVFQDPSGHPVRILDESRPL